MAGHSKWANIQHRKKAQDAKRGRLFTVLIREIASSARAGGTDIHSNPRLRLAVDKAYAANMSKEVVERALKRGGGELEGQTYEEIRYEGFARAGVAVMVDCLSDNRNRTVAEIRHAFTRHGGRLGQSGSVAHLFQPRGVLCYAKDTHEDNLLEAVLECHGEDVRATADAMQVVCAPSDLFLVQDCLAKKGLLSTQVSVEEEVDNHVCLDSEQAESVVCLLNSLTDLDDVQSVYSNADLSDQQDD